mmetsp:Transcript_19463/g.58021  ORF Transcript_19463/g.58021 Transcript_19463/m.58021 type:complete len:421 (+) Transcript_19463:597-1859(+)
MREIGARREPPAHKGRQPHADGGRRSKGRLRVRRRQGRLQEARRRGDRICDEQRVQHAVLLAHLLSVEHDRVHRGGAHVDKGVGVGLSTAQPKESEPTLDRVLAVLAQLARLDSRRQLAVEVREHHARRRVDARRDGAPLVRLNLWAARVSKALVRAEVAAAVRRREAQLRRRVALLQLGPRVEASCRVDVLRQLGEHLDVHRDGELVEMVSAAILAKGHARDDERFARQLEARHARRALAHVAHLAAPFEANRQPVRLTLEAASAVVEARVPRHEEGRLPRLARRAQPRKVAADGLLALARVALQLDLLDLLLELLLRLGLLQVLLLRQLRERRGALGGDAARLPLDGRWLVARLALRLGRDALEQLDARLLILWRAEQLHEVVVRHVVISAHRAHKEEHLRRRDGDPQPLEGAVHLVE